MRRSNNLELCLNYFKDKEELGVDTETTGLNPFLHELLSIQVGDKDMQFVLRPEVTEDPRFVKLLTSKTVIFQNAKFDLGFLLQKGIVFHKNVYDTMLAERILTVGTKHRVNLAYITKKYFNIELNKEVRKDLESLGFDNPIFQDYAAGDVEYLPQIKAKQKEQISKLEMDFCLELENRFVVVLAYIENCGFYVNKPKWKQKMILDLKEVELLEEQLDQCLLSYGIQPYLIKPSLFGPYTTRLIKWSSSQQVISAFEKLGMNLEYFDKKQGKLKKSVDQKHLRGIKHPIIEIYRKYQTACKRVNTYGHGYLTELNLYQDSRLRTRFRQIMDTSRLSSGSGKVNFQNIPRVPDKKERTREIYERECFQPEEGNVLITADYSSQESRLLAHFSQDPALLEFYNSGEADLHSYATKMVFKSKYPEMETMTLKEIKNKFSEERRIMKGFNFALTLAPCCRKAA